MWTCWLIRRKVVSNQRNGSWSQGDKVRADGKMQQPLFHAIPRQHGPHCTASVYHHLQFALEFRKYPLGMALQLNVQFISHQSWCVEFITWDKQDDLIGFQCKYTEAPCKAFSPISSLLPQSPTSCVSFLPPSFRYVWNLGVVVNDWPWCGLENRWNNSIIYMKLVWFGWMCYTELQSGPFTEYLALTPFLLMSALEVPLLCDLFE